MKAAAAYSSIKAPYSSFDTFKEDIPKKITGRQGRAGEGVGLCPGLWGVQGL
jgi:hypothetical protein